MTGLPGALITFLMTVTLTHVSSKTRTKSVIAIKKTPQGNVTNFKCSIVRIEGTGVEVTKNLNKLVKQKIGINLEKTRSHVRHM